MTSIRPLDAQRHAALCVQPMRGAAARRLVQVGRSEIALVAADMPLCLAKDAQTGRFNLIALMGLIEPDNLFGRDGAIGATYVPRAAMLTGFRTDPAGTGGLALDEADPSLGTQGDPLFERGHPTDLVARVRADLDYLIADVAAAQALVDSYAHSKVIRPLRFELAFEGDRSHAIEGLYSVSDAALATLDDATVVAMHRDDRLAPAAVMAASLAQVERLRQLHNARGHAALQKIGLSIDD